MDITTKTEVELKAMIYDQLVIVERTQQNIKFLNEELQKRATKVEPKVEPKPQNAK